MAGNEYKTPLSGSLNDVAQRRVQDAVQIAGKALPCKVVSKHNSIVTVQFLVNADGATLPQVTVPIFGAEYVRLPVQAGCLGVVFPADVRLGGVTGLGLGQPTFDDVPNLTALVFFPVGNKNFSSVDPNTLVLYGEPDTLMQDKTGASKVLATPSGLTLSSNGHTLMINSTGILLDGKVWATHAHTEVQGGTDNTGPVA